jgi:hypothetical protein
MLRLALLHIRELQLQNNSIQFSSIVLLLCRLNRTSANYKANTRAQIQHKTVQIHKNKTQNRKNETNIAGGIKRNVRVLGQNPYALKRDNKSLIKSGLQLNVQLSLLMPLATEAHQAEGQLRRLRST